MELRPTHRLDAKRVLTERAPVGVLERQSQLTAASECHCYLLLACTDGENGWRQVSSLGHAERRAVLHEGQELSLEALRDFANDHLARYKLPLRLHIVDALPRNPAGKVLKFVLKEQLTD